MHAPGNRRRKPASHLGATERRLVASGLLGVALGASNSLSNVFGTPYGHTGLSPDGVVPLQVIGAVLGTPWAWAVTGFAAGWIARRIWAGPLAGVIALLLADLTYYLAEWASGYTGGFEQPELVHWGKLAVFTGVVMGLLGALAAQRRWWSLAPGLAAPAAIVVLAAPTGTDEIQPWPTIVTNVVAVAVALIVVGGWARDVFLRYRRPDPRRPEAPE